MHEFVYCVASTIILYAQGSRDIFQPEKFLDRTGNRTHRLWIGNSVPLLTRLSETHPTIVTITTTVTSVVATTISTSTTFVAIVDSLAQWFSTFFVPCP